MKFIEWGFVQIERLASDRRFEVILVSMDEVSAKGGRKVPNRKGVAKRSASTDAPLDRRDYLARA